MSLSTLNTPRNNTTPREAGFLASMARRAVFARLEDLKRGRLSILDAQGERVFEGPLPGPEARIIVNDASFYVDVASRGSVGAGEAYARGAWQADDLVSVIRLMVLNRETLQGVEGGIAKLAQPALKLYHMSRPNSLSGARRNISAHYDLSNEFFSLFLDRTMTYSAGVFENDNASLEQASIAKLDRICRKIGLAPHHEVLEIGTGWGSFAIHAARYYGARVTTTTISREQYDLAVQRIEEAGVADRVTVLLEDFRALDGQFDRIVSIEMIEAIGHENYEAFFAKCADLLREDGAMLLQAITIRDQFYESARASVDFIKRYIFPGCNIPSVGALHQAMTRVSDLGLAHMEDIGEHYALTLAAWRRNLLERQDEARELGFDDEFLRLWEFYLAYCEGGFAERQLGDAQMLLARPLYREPLPLPRAAFMGR